MSAFQPVPAPGQPFGSAQNGLAHHYHSWPTTAQQFPNVAQPVASLPTNHYHYQQQLGANPPLGALSFPTTAQGLLSSTLAQPPSTLSNSPFLLQPQQPGHVSPSLTAHVSGTPLVSPLTAGSTMLPQSQYAVKPAVEPQVGYGANFAYPSLSMSAKCQQVSTVPLNGAIVPSSHTAPLGVNPSLYYGGAATSMMPTVSQPSMTHVAAVAGGVPLSPSPLNRTPGAYPMQPGVSPAQAVFASPVSPVSPASYSPVAHAGHAQVPLHTLTPGGGSGVSAMQFTGECCMDTS